MAEDLSDSGGTSAGLIRMLVSGAAIGGSIKLAGVGLAFLVFLVLSRATTPEEFGIFASAFSLATILGFVAPLGQHTAILRFWPAFDETRGRPAASRATARGLALTAFGVTVVLVLFAVLALSPPKVDAFGEGGGIYLWTGIMAAAFALSEFSVAALRARGLLAGALGPREVGWRLAVIGTVLLLPHPLSGSAAMMIVALGLVAMTLPQMSVVAAEVWRYRRERLPSEDRAAMQHAMWGLTALAGVNQISAHGTTIVIGFVLGPTAAGAFFAADRLAKLLTIALIGVNQIAGPMLARSYHAGRMDEVRLIASVASLLASAAAFIGAGLYIYAGHFILGLFDPNYADFYPILLILALGQVVNAGLGVNGLLLSLAGKERTLFVIMAVWGIGGIGAVIVGAFVAGALGAAIAFALSIIAWNMSAALLCKFHLGVTLYSSQNISGIFTKFVLTR